MTQARATSGEQHNVEIRENRKHWEAKPLLHDIYRGFHREIRSRLVAVPGVTAELGSGIGQIKEVIPECITTDMFPNPWLDQVENAYALSFEAGSVANLILFDVFHHLEFPGRAFAEFSRVVSPGGRVILFEPAMGWLGRFIYGNFHHEPLGFEQAISWDAPVGFDVQAAPYFAAQARAHRIFGWRETLGELRGFRVVEVTYFPALAYIASGGLRGPQLIPRNALSLVNRLERLLCPFPAIFASRMLVALDRTIAP